MSLSISVVVANESRTFENTLLRYDTLLPGKQAVEYRAKLEQWLSIFPIPGQENELPVDQASELAFQLPRILGGRDPVLFSPYYEDPEFEASIIERRPYDYTRLETV